ncbi:MAG: hypothetical protein WCF93_01105 [Candidatus Moraniibacteriota bacterium]
MRKRNTNKNNVNKKVASEFAIGVVLLVAIVVGGSVWLKNSREVAILDQQERQVQSQVVLNKDIPNQIAEKVVGNDSCQAHYYEGSSQVQCRFVSEDKDGIVVAISKNDASKLPVKNYQEDNTQQSFNVKLVDPTKKISASIKASSAKKPVTLTVQGYAEVCQPLPLISLKPATVAFKKQS